jgi:hypothetical protein
MSISMPVTTRYNPGWNALLTFSQIQKEMGINREQVFHLVTSRGFPLVKIGRTYRIPCKALVRWLVQEAGITPGLDSPRQTQDFQHQSDEMLYAAHELAGTVEAHYV